MTAADVIACCRVLAGFSEEAGATTRTFLSAPMRDVHATLTQAMQRAGMDVRLDAAGNLRGLYPGVAPDAPRLIIGSHLDTVRGAGAFDGILGVALGIAVVQRLGGRRLPLAIEVIGFSEEEGVRFGTPFIGSRALAGTADETLLSRTDAHGTTVREAIAAFGLDPAGIPSARAAAGALGYLELHIEQGPVLDTFGLPLGVVNAIAGQSRLMVTFTGTANHAGTTPMGARRDAVAGAAEWIVAVERDARIATGAVATVGQVDAIPGATNVIAGACRASLDVRHPHDGVRHGFVERLLTLAREIASRRQLTVTIETTLDQPAVPMDPELEARLERAVEFCGYPVHVLPSGAGHDAMVLAPLMPVAMLFLRTPGGVSHHPDESVREEDVAAALRVAGQFIDDLAVTR